MTAETSRPSSRSLNSVPSTSGVNWPVTTTPISWPTPPSSRASTMTVSATGRAVSTRCSPNSRGWAWSLAQMASKPLPLPATPPATERSRTPTVRRVYPTSSPVVQRLSAVEMARLKTRLGKSVTMGRMAMVCLATLARHRASAFTGSCLQVSASCPIRLLLLRQ